MAVESRFPRIDVPKVDIWTFLFERKDRPYPEDKLIFRDANTDRTYTFGQVKATALDFAKGLKSVWEWKKGQVLGLYLPNCIDTPAITFGTLWCGGIICPANPLYTVEELASQLKDCGAKALITTLEHLPNARAACKLVGIDDEFIALAGDNRDPDARIKHFTSVRNISGATRYRKTKIDPDKDLAFLVYSSGTTGKPKGVMLLHRNLCANVLQLHAAEAGILDWKGGPKDEGDKILAFLPFFHIYGLTCFVMQAIHRGFQIIVMSRFEIEQFCAQVQKHRVTFTYLVPPVLLALAKHPVVSKYDLSSLKMTNCGAAPLTRELVDLVHKRIGLPVKQGYGLSETSPASHIQRWGDWDKTTGSVGWLLSGMSAKYVDPHTGADLSPGQVGEICLKGPNVFAGYLNQPEVTRAAFTPDGFFRTGDVGYEDQDGNFYITDRVKELIKYKGFQVAPAELEGLLLDHPSVDDAAVIGLYNTDMQTELPRGYVVLKSGVPADETTRTDILTWLHKRVAAHKKLRGGLYFVAQIPKSTSGKILRKDLKEQALKELGPVQAKL